jgi:hypothetical protein
MQFAFRPSLRAFKIITLIAVITSVLLYFLLIDGRHRSEVENLKRVVFKRDEFINELAGPKDMIYPVAQNYNRKDWHDWKFIESEKLREGPGEKGRPFNLTDPKDIALNQKLFKIEGLYVIASDKISVNRSVPDTRLPV